MKTVKKVLKGIGIGFAGLIGLFILIGIFAGGETESAEPEVKTMDEKVQEEIEKAEQRAKEGQSLLTEEQIENIEKQAEETVNKAFEESFLNDEPAEEAVEEVVEEEPEMSVSQQNAVRSAESYISMMAFSKTGLIEQLEFEGYSKEDATFAVEGLNVDWKQQAVKSAENYLDMMGFSRQGLIDQLVFEGYTTEEATFGVDQVGL